MIDLRSTPWAGRYGVALIDYPWKFETRSPKGMGLKDPSVHYQVAEVPKLAHLPVSETLAPDCWLFLWVTWPMLAANQHNRLVEAWGDPANPWVGVTGGAWAKRPRGWRGDPDKWQFGTGYLFRSASEPLIVYRRGAPASWTSKSERGLWVAPIREHSRKPDEVRAMIDRTVPPCPRLEMFGREPAPGWDAWGNEADKFKKKPRRKA